MKFSKAPAHPDEILQLITRVPAGRDVLGGFMELYRSGRVRLEPYPQALLAQLRAALGEGQPVGACFVNDGETGTIHYDPQAPIGVLGPFLVHEMVHAMDQSLWSAARIAQTRDSRDKLMLEAETRAFELQYRFVQELRAADPEYGFFLENEQERVRILNERLSREDIAELYGLTG
jgi:hypothetical protein